MAVGILLFGPLSDKYGRKPMLIAGTCIYMIFSGACALAPSVGFLIGSRIIQALGAGCMVAVSTALIKDCFERQTRDVVLAVVQAMAVIAPMVAPVAGAWIVTLSGWRATFWLLAIIALLCLVAVAFLQETLHSEERESISVLKSLGGLIKVGKNPGFSHSLWIYACFLRKRCADNFPFMLYTVYRNGKCRASLQHCDAFKSAGKGYGICIGSYKFYTYCIR